MDDELKRIFITTALSSICDDFRSLNGEPENHYDIPTFIDAMSQTELMKRIQSRNPNIKGFEAMCLKYPSFHSDLRVAAQQIKLGNNRPKIEVT